MPTRFARPAAALSAGVIVLALAACGGGAATASPSAEAPGDSAEPAVSASAATSPEPAGSASPAATEGNASSGEGVAAACDLLTAENIDEVTGWGVATAEAGPQMGIFEDGCHWTLTEGSFPSAPAEIILGVMPSGGRQYYDTFFAPFTEENGDVPIARLGDVAVQDEIGTVLVVGGDVLFNVQWLDGFDASEEAPVELARRILENLAQGA